MVSLNMYGPYNLTISEIDKQITKTSAGNYALGYFKDRTFYVRYVGRSDNDVNDRLRHWVGKYKQFKYSYASSPKNAFEKECQNYHDFGESEKLDNKMHPDRPNDAKWKCPVCYIFD